MATNYTKEIWSWKKEIIEGIAVFLLGCVVAFAFNPSLADSEWPNIRLNASYSGFMWLFFWKGNQYLVNFWNNRISWLEQPMKRFIIGFVTVLIYTPLILFLLNKSYNYFTTFYWGMTQFDIIVSLGVTYLITFFMFAREFLKNWKKAIIDSERMKKEQMAAQYESLKNQVNPHFLFNSLNALTNLVYEDRDQAAKFIRELSRVYRYVLDTRSQELVSLKTEMDFVDAYIFLQKIRFDDKLEISIDYEGYEQKMIPPMALQMLLENAIKHNVIAEEQHLKIDFAVNENGMLIVKNNLQKKNIPSEDSSGMGLANIQSRYEFLSDRKVEIVNGPTEFIVKVPLLDFEK